MFVFHWKQSIQARVLLYTCTSLLICSESVSFSADAVEGLVCVDAGVFTSTI